MKIPEICKALSKELLITWRVHYHILSAWKRASRQRARTILELFFQVPQGYMLVSLVSDLDWPQMQFKECDIYKIHMVNWTSLRFFWSYWIRIVKLICYCFYVKFCRIRFGFYQTFLYNLVSRSWQKKGSRKVRKTKIKKIKWWRPLILHHQLLLSHGKLKVFIIPSTEPRILEPLFSSLHFYFLIRFEKTWHPFESSSGWGTVSFSFW